ncbi:MAG: hypothetical protein ACR2KV_04305 [Solirubrobacteraceae bacterium]
MADRPKPEVAIRVLPLPPDAAPTPQQRVILAYARTTGAHDAILAHTHCLVEALERTPGIESAMVLRARARRWATPGAPAAASLALTLRRLDAEVVALQYNPFSYGRWGIAPSLLAEIINARRVGALRRLALVVHEPYVNERGWRMAAMGAVQRPQLSTLIGRADVVLATSAAWSPMLRGLRDGTEVMCVPVGSNLPDRRADRLAARRELLGPETSSLVVASLGLVEAHQQVRFAAAAMESLIADGHHVVHLNLGRTADLVSFNHPHFRSVRPGPLPDAQLARMLASADLFLGPYRDGVTTRRTTLMAAMQHAVCVVATVAASSDIELTAGGAIALADVRELRAFAEHARRLGADVAARRRQGLAGRGLFEECFTWDRLAGRFLEALW